MKLINSGDPQFKPSVVMMVYGEGGVGKTTFASTSPKPLLADCEGGSKYFGLRGINIPVAIIENWADMGEVLKLAKGGEYDTIIIDPIGELMEMLKKYMIFKGDAKNVQKDGTPSMAGWGWLKKTMKDYIKALRAVGKHVIIIAHVEEKEDEGRIVKRPKVETKLADDLRNMVDIVAYMTTITKDEEEMRILRVDPTSDKFVAKDRTGQLGQVIPPDFEKIVEACQGTKKYSWMNEKATVKPEQPEEKPTTDKVSKEDKKLADALGLDEKDIPTEETTVSTNDEELTKKLVKAKGTNDGGENN